MNRPHVALAAVVSVALAIVLLSGLFASTGGLAFDTPTSGLYVELDCDPSTPGIQDTCNLLTGTSGIDVAFVAFNVNVPSVILDGFYLSVRTSQQSAFNPPSTAISGTNGNPDLDEQSLGTSWQCGGLWGDVNPDSMVADSEMICGTTSGVALPPGGSLRLATVHYDVQALAATGQFSPRRLDLYVDQGPTVAALSLGVCNPNIDHYGPCSPANVNIADPTETPTPCANACPTQTATPTQTASAIPEPTPATSSCSGNPFFTPVLDGAITRMLFDKWCQHLFALNPTKNRIDVVSMSTGALEAPISVGRDPEGFDFSPDGLLLYVADAGSGDIRVYDTLSRTEIRRINVPGVGTCLGVPMSLATSSNGLVFFKAGVSFGCSSATLMQLDPSTDLITERADLPFGTSSMELARSRDHSVIVLGGLNEITRYQAVKNSWGWSEGSYIRLPSDFAGVLDVDESGNNIFVNGGYRSLVLDGALNLNATIGGQGYGMDAGAAISRSGTAGYHVTSAGLEVLDLTSYLPQVTIALGDSVSNGSYGLAQPRRVRLSPDDTLAAVATDHGIDIVAVPPQPPAIPSHSIAPTPTPSVVGCSTGLPPFSFTPILGAPLSKVVIDRWCERAYAPNPSLNQVEVLNLRTGDLESPIHVGSRPTGLDLSQDPQIMYVANGGGNYISVVDLGGRAELRRVYLPAPSTNSFSLSVPSSVFEAASGRVLVGGAEKMITYDPATGQSMRRDDFDRFGYTDPQLVMAAPASRAVIGIDNQRSASLYTSATDSFSAGTDLGYNASAITHDDATNGWAFASATHVELRGNAFQFIRSAERGGGGVAVSSDGEFVYLANSTGIDILNGSSLQLFGHLDSGDPGAHNLAESADRSLFVVVTNNGLSIVREAFDSDSDGCGDVKELGLRHLLGGERDPNSPWDFFDVPTPPLLPSNTTGARDKKISLTGDVLSVLQYVGTNAANPSMPNANDAQYGSDLNGNGIADGVEYDRTVSTTPGQPWRSGPPDGKVTLSGDVLPALYQVGTSCN